MPQLSTCLWFNTEAEPAAHFHVSIFPNSRIKEIVMRPPSAPGKTGDVLTVTYELDGRPFIGLNGGPHFTFNEAISLVVQCHTQDEIDHYWTQLTDGGAQSQCGWLKDRFGVSWQVVSVAMPGWLNGSAAQAERVAAAIMTMKKLNIAALEAAARG